MILSFSQPAFIPWGGFFSRLTASDCMVLLDDTLFARGYTFVNRNRLKGAGGEVWNTVPIVKKGRGRQRIKDLEIYDKSRWAAKFLATLEQNYAKSIYFSKVFKELTRLLQEEDNRFLPMIINILELMKTGLSINTPFMLQSGLGIQGQGTDLLLDIAKEMSAGEVILPYPARSLVEWRKLEEEGIEVQFLKYQCPVYPQFRGDFISCLSMLDMFFCLGKDSTRLLGTHSSLIKEKP